MRTKSIIMLANIIKKNNEKAEAEYNAFESGLKEKYGELDSKKYTKEESEQYSKLFREKNIYYRICCAFCNFELDKANMSVRNIIQINDILEKEKNCAWKNYVLLRKTDDAMRAFKEYEEIAQTYEEFNDFTWNRKK